MEDMLNDNNEMFIEFANAMRPVKRPPGRPKGSRDKKKLAEEEAELAKKGKKAGQNAKEVEFTMKVLAIADGADPDDIQSLKDRFIEYLKLCRDADHKVGNLAAYASIGIDNKIAARWTNAESRRKSPEHGFLIDAINKICGMYRESLIQSGGLERSIGKFWQVNYDGLAEESTQGSADVDEGKAESTPEAIAAKYKNLPK